MWLWHIKERFIHFSSEIGPNEWPQNNHKWELISWKHNGLQIYSTANFLWGCFNHPLEIAALVSNVNTSAVFCTFYVKFLSLLLLSDTLWTVASAPENILGCRGGLLHGGIDRHLHVPVQECFWAVQADNGHVRGRVSVWKSTHTAVMLVSKGRSVTSYTRMHQCCTSFCVNYQS